MDRTDWNSSQVSDADGLASYPLAKEDGVARASDPASPDRTAPGITTSAGLQGRMSDEMSAELFERIAIGRSEVAFREFHDLLYKGVYARIFRILKSEQDALDMAQEVFATFWTSAPDLYKLHTNITAWILLLARNRAIDHTRSKHFRGQRASESYDDILHGYLSEDSHSADERLMSESIRIELQSAFEVLNPKHREIMVHVFLEGMSMKAVAEAMDIPHGTVKKTVFSSIRKLRRELHPEEARLHQLNKKAKAIQKEEDRKKNIEIKKETKAMEANAKETVPVAAKKAKRPDGKSRRASKLHTILDDLIQNRDSASSVPVPPTVDQPHHYL